MRKTLIAIILLATAGYWLWTNNFVGGRSVHKTEERGGTPTSPQGNKPESRYLSVWQSCQMPALNDAWDTTKLLSVGSALKQLQANHPNYLPDAQSAAGKAFFSKLCYTVGRFHLLRGQDKIPAYNAFKEFLPIYVKSHTRGRPRDLEIALLIGLQIEMIAGITEDQEFESDLSNRTTRTAGSLDGGIWTMRGSAIGFQGGARGLEKDTHDLLKAIGDQKTLRTDARKLVLGYLGLHLPTIARQTKMSDLRPLVQSLRDRENDAEVRAHYDTLLTRL